MAVMSVCLWVGCTSAATELKTAQTLYKDARYEDALQWLTELERDTQGMSAADQTRFYYLRGMTAFRLGQRDDALHFLAKASVLQAEDPSRLPAPWRPVMERTLLEITPREATHHARNPLRPDTY
jgi:hypothetical protein